MSRKRLFATTTFAFAGLGLAPIWLAGAAQAQASSPPAAALPSTPSGGTAIETIVVTAQRREESLQKVPVSVTALTGDALTRLQVRSAFDLQYSTPNLEVNNTEEGGRLGQSYEIRGQTANADDAPPGVVEYLADVPVQSQEVARSNYDLRSIQVLEGPQGTLFGRNTNGGAVLFTPNKPTQDFGGYLTGQYGNYNDRYLEGEINIPITSALSVRAAGNIERRDGFTKNISGPDVDNASYDTFRVGVDFKPSSRFENDFLLNGEYANERGPGYILSSASPCATGAEATCLYSTSSHLGGALPPFLLIPGYNALGLKDFAAVYAQQQALGVRKIDAPNPGFEREHGFGIANTTTLKLNDDLTLKNIFGYHELSTSDLNTFTDTVDPALTVGSNIHYKTVTEELQLLGHTDDNRFTWILGGYYFDQKQTPYSETDVNYATNNGLVAEPFLLEEPQFIKLTLKSEAVYGQGTVDLSQWVHGLSFTGGYRYTWDQPDLSEKILEIVGPLSILQAQGLPAGTYCATGGALASCNYSAQKRYNAPNWTLSLNEQLDSHTLLYIASRHGYKSGGFNSTTTDPQYGSYAPEKLTDVEGGAKLDLHLGNVAIRANAAVFYDWYTNLQLNNVVFIGGTPSSIISNTCTGPIGTGAGDCPDHDPSTAHIYGGELGLTVVPVRSLTLGLNYGYQKGVYDHFIALTNGGTLQDFSGRNIAALPENTLSANATWRLPIDPSYGDVSLTGAYSYRSGYNLALDATNASAASPYAIVNARLDWKNIFGKPVDAALFVKNLTDKVYPLGFEAAGAFGFNSRYYGEPRLFGVSLTYHFGR